MSDSSWGWDCRTSTSTEGWRGPPSSTARISARRGRDRPGAGGSRREPGCSGDYAAGPCWSIQSRKARVNLPLLVQLGVDAAGLLELVFEDDDAACCVEAGAVVDQGRTRIAKRSW